MPELPPGPFSPDALLLESLLAPSRHPRRFDRDRDWSIDSVMERAAQSLPELDSAVKDPASLLSELLALDRGRIADALDDRPSLLRPIFLDHVRRTALAALPQQPDLAEVLSFLAVQQSQASADVEEARRHLIAAYCLLASIRRLQRNPAEADDLLTRGSFLLGSFEDQALFLRTLAVLRWEQGRAEEAHALLARAVLLKRSPETARIQLLLGLLHVVEGVAVPRPLAMLRYATRSIDAAHEPFPSLLARLGLAYAAAQRGDLTAARAERQVAQGLFPLLTDDKAAAFAGWLDTRVSLYTAPEGGLERLRFSRLDLVERGLPLAATLATIDAVLFLAAARQPHLIGPFLADAPLPLPLPPALQICEDLAAPPKGPAWFRVHLRREASRLPGILRRMCLLRGIATEPLPFV
jgi:tetratricopeptide (TPR) repeat protein